jgi:hypothetical protein
MAFTQGYALVIGVGRHQYSPYLDVPITAADAKAVAETLQDGSVCGYPAAQVTLLDNKGASKGGILTALGELAERAKPEETVFLYYCGHGALGTDGNYYLVSHDAKLKGARVVKDTGVSESELISQLRAIPARRVLMVFNACFSGNISPTLAIEDQGLDAESLSEDTSEALLGTGEGRVIITACREDQRSYIGSGPLTIFTQALVDGLKGKGVSNRGGYISAYNLYECIYAKVSEIVEEKYHEKQEPELTVLKGVGPFAVALFRGAASLGTFDADQPVPDLPAVRQVTLEKAQRAMARQINTGGGAYIGRDVGGDFAGGDIFKVGDMVGNVGVAIGRGAYAEGRQTVGLSDQELERVFAPLMQVVHGAPKSVQPQAERIVEELKDEIGKGKQEDDTVQARLIDGLIGLVPGAVSSVASMFASPMLAALVGPFTKFVLENTQKKSTRHNQKKG